MALIAVLAVLLSWAVNRPYPIMATGSASWFVGWSDGNATHCEAGPKTLKLRGNSWISIVDWPDGATSYYLTVRSPR